MRRLLTIAAILLISMISFAKESKEPETERAPANVTTTKIGNDIVQGSQLIRVVDQEMGNVCYVAHGRAVNAGVGVYCLPLKK